MNHMDMKAIGQKIRTLRREQGFTLITLGKKLGLSYTHVSRLECGRQGIRIEILAKLARILGVEPASLLVEGQDVSQAGVIEALDAAGLMPSDTLISALKDKDFLKLMERCAAAMWARKENLGKMERALRSI